jgi:prepilin-type N-terminal cleavage/methylation domain-containing protein
MNPLKSIHSMDQKGFTLLEILIAMFILAAVLSTIFTSYTGTFRIIGETESQTDIYAMARIVLARMQEDLESTHLKASEDSESEEGPLKRAIVLGENKEINGRDADTLRFLSRAHIVLDEDHENTGIAEISYYVIQKEEGDSLLLYRSDTLELEEVPEEGTGGLLLCDGLSSINVTYHDVEGEMYESWDSSHDELEIKLPARVSIMLEFVNPTNPEVPHKFMTSVALPMAREIDERAF